MVLHFWLIVWIVGVYIYDNNENSNVQHAWGPCSSYRGTAILRYGINGGGKIINIVKFGILL